MSDNADSWNKLHVCLVDDGYPTTIRSSKSDRQFPARDHPSSASDMRDDVNSAWFPVERHDGVLTAQIHSTVAQLAEFHLAAFR
jgi:hypothetical protein